MARSTRAAIAFVARAPRAGPRGTLRDAARARIGADRWSCRSSARPVPVLVFGNGTSAARWCGARRAAGRRSAGSIARERTFPAHAPRNVEVVATDVPEAELRERRAAASCWS
jgi:hypothetical protein